MRKHTLAAALLTLATNATAAPAPTADPVMNYYHAYRAALDAGDGETPETNAAAALAASVARDGDGGRTGVLAINLATTRLMNDHIAEAYAPALQASTIAANNPSAGVDPLQARLVLGRAELTARHDDAGRALLLAALREAAPNEALGAEAYLAARALGLWTLTHNELGEAATAWGFAKQFAAFAPTNPAFARGEARMEEGVALFMNALADARLRNAADKAVQRQDFNESAVALNEAVTLLRPFGTQRGPNNALTIGQQTYARALAWTNVAYSILISSDIAPPQALTPQHPPPAAPASDPLNSCGMTVRTTPRPSFPHRALNSLSVGSVVVFVSISESGVITRRVAASVPEDQGFVEAVEQVLPLWTIERSPNPPSACMPFAWVPITFGIR